MFWYLTKQSKFGPKRDYFNLKHLTMGMDASKLQRGPNKTGSAYSFACK